MGNRGSGTKHTLKTAKENEIMMDQNPEDEKNTQLLTGESSDTEEITNCSKYEHTDETITSVEPQMTSGHYQDNKDTKKNTLTSQAEKHRDESGQHEETEIKNRVGVIYPEMSRVAAAHSQADGGRGDIKVDTEPSQGDHVGAMATGDSDSSSFTVVLFGNTSAVHLGEENVLLGAEHVPPDQAHHPREIKVFGRGLSVVNILGDMYLDHVDRITTQLANENNIHAFIFVLKLGQFTDDDKIGLEWLEREFGESALSFVIILFTYETVEECDTIIDELKNSTVLEQLIKKCQGRYCTCSMDMNKHSEIITVLNKIDQLICENNQCSYTAEIYNTGLQFRDDVQDRGRQKAIRQEDPLFQDDSKHDIEIKIEITDDYSKTTRDALEQNKADEHDGSIHELVSFQKEDLLKIPDTLRIVLLGKTGVGKSATGNTILGKKVFNEDLSYESVTCVCQTETAEVWGRQITVIDTPGIDTSSDSDEIMKEIVKCISMAAPGPHVFLLVFKIGQRFSQEERETVSIIEKLFGEKCNMYTIVLFTGGDMLKGKTVDQYVEKAGTHLKTLVSEFGNRYHAFNNNDKNSSTQVLTLLNKIDEMVTLNGGSYYTNEMFQQWEICAETTALKQEKHREHKMEENGCEEIKRSRIEQLFRSLNLVEKHQQKIKPLDVLQITPRSFNCQESCTVRDLVEMFIQRLLMMDYRARYITTNEYTDTEQTDSDPGDEEDLVADFLSNKMAFSHSVSDADPVHPMDVQMAVFHCSDHFLRQLIVNKLAQCQYALPLLVPNPFTGEIEFPLWTFHQIRKSWKTTDSSGKKVSKTQAVYEAKTPMVAFFRFGSAPSSKSQLMNSLINEKHHTFFHRHCPGSTKDRLLVDGVVEIAWYCPSGKENDNFPDCVSFCNLHGDAETNKDQLEILTQMSSVNVVLVSHANEITNIEILEKLLKGAKPLICLLSDNEFGVSRIRNGKYKIGLKNRNQSDVAKNLRITIKECLSNSTSIFKIEDLVKTEVMRKDEDDSECKRGKEAAENIMSQLKGTEVSKLKEKHLPCQGKLWHDWCEMNKDLHRLQGHNLEREKSEKQREMKQIRGEQNKHKLSGLIEKFIDSLNLPGENEKHFFLKWVGIFLDKHTADVLLVLYQKYNEKWTAVLDLKKNHDKSDKMMEEQKELEHLSEELNAAMFGLEHILREMGQIYESFTSVQTHEERSKDKIIKTLPKLAAELMKSGHPLELMDGDAAHVPLIWVSAVLDELVELLGDPRVFVLSVLGNQSSGKSTMLNAMFGLQFTVSAGRCTRGAFMQLVRVSEEMKEQLKFDYILVVDTEGLRALELAGKSTQHHDNELATFVVGLGNLTLINIFGENPAEMQDILQIVVQAFLRMKKFILNPRCMFVHQNVSDITAGEKNMEGRRRLQEKLDEMTKLAAKEEDSEADCFSDVIEFSVQDDVYYFAQLWEGSPPMAPPNPCYSRHVQNLKNAIFKRAEKSTVMALSQFKSRVSDLWNALLNENFVFSFKNTLEIAVYRKLETEFGKWTWTLRRAMLDTEEKLHNKIENEKMKKINEKDLHFYMKETKEEVDKSIKCYFEEDKDKDILIQWRVRCETKIAQLYEGLVKDTKQNVNEVIQQQQARESFEHKREQYDEKLFSLSKDLALKLKSISTDEQVLKDGFDELWDKCVTGLTRDTPKERSIDFWEDAVQILSVGNELTLVCERIYQQYYRHIDSLGDYSCYISNLKRQKWFHFVHFMSKLSFEGNELVRTLIINVIKDTKDLMNKICNKITRLGYKDSYIQEITDHVRRRVEEHLSETQRSKLKKEFTLDLCLHVCELASHRFTECHERFREANDTRVYLSKQKPQYYNVFKNYCRGATTTKVFGDLICSNLSESILQSVYNKTAIDLAAQIRSDMPEFNGNRSNLEKHILKCLAEEENFKKYKEYIHHPRKHFTHFITEKVNEYMTDNNTTVLKVFKGNLKDKEQRVINALHFATEEVTKSHGDADMWMRSFSFSLKDELNFKEITFTDHKEITDFDFLQRVVGEGLTAVMSELDKSFNSVKDINMKEFRKKPDEILIEHLCQCCWVQCPFCKAICTNTIEGHDGDHSVPFHRVTGISGWHYRGTTILCCNICTTNVQSDKSFYPGHDPGDPDRLVLYKSYRSAGGVYATWSITPDNSQLSYWKWFVCRFQKDLEKHYEKTFEGYGEIPREWGDFTKEQAIESLDEYI